MSSEPTSAPLGVFSRPEPDRAPACPAGDRPATPQHRARILAFPGRRVTALAINPNCAHSAPGELFEYGQTVLVELFTLSVVVDHVTGFIVAWEVDRVGEPTKGADVRRLVDLSFRSRPDALNGEKVIGGGTCLQLVAAPGTPMDGIEGDDRFTSFEGETDDGCTTAMARSVLDRLGLEIGIVMTEPASLELGAVNELRSTPIRLAPQIRFFALAVAHGVWRNNYRLTPGRSTSAYERLVLS
ncbi:MAG: hypothetical protein HKN03_07230 [Acidimicrobiales bacterium]|nr:hypothetical protein [Acidimicrobiales bacterium]